MPSLTSGNLIGSSVRPAVGQAKFSQAGRQSGQVQSGQVQSGNLTVGSTAYGTAFSTPTARHEGS